MARRSQPAPKQAFRFSPRPNRANEINWYPWNDRTLGRAQQKDKLVFLAISAFWCHWCHVMDETTYSDAGVIDLLNTKFISFRADTDQRPDINRRYNQGGWPSFAILAPTGEVLIGGTYIAPSELRKLLTQVLAYYAGHRDEVRDKIEEARRKREGLRVEPPSAGELSAKPVGDTLQLLRDAYDPTHGGFERAPKFPHVGALELLLESYYRTKEVHWLDMAKNTLSHMMEGGLFDKVAGGFFRYSTTWDWSVPHYEKMLEDNARLIALYFKALQITHDDRYGEIARRTMAYLNSTLLDGNSGCFFGSQDAEEEFYFLPSEERLKRRAPAVDQIIYTDWNALVATAYIAAYRVDGDDEYLQRALHILDFLWANCRDESRGMYHSWDGTPDLLGFLPDQVRVASAMLEGYEATGKSVFLQRAEKIADLLRRDYYDEVGGGFYDLAHGGVAVETGKLVERDKSIEDNAEAADLLIALHALNDREEYRNLAERALMTFLDDYPQYGLFAASYARATDHFLHEPLRITVVGMRQRAGTQKLLRESLKTFAPATVVEFLDQERDHERIEALGYGVGPFPAVYVCHGRTCSAPILRAEDLGSVVDSLI